MHLSKLRMAHNRQTPVIGIFLFAAGCRVNKIIYTFAVVVRADMKPLTWEDEMVVEAAMAFIDSLNADEISLGKSEKSRENNDDSAHSTSDSSSTPHKTRNAPTDKGQRKRKYTPGYSTKLLRQKKAEVNRLRSQVPVLEEWLEQLKHLHSNSEAEHSPVGKFQIKIVGQPTRWRSFGSDDMLSTSTAN